MIDMPPTAGLQILAIRQLAYQQEELLHEIVLSNDTFLRGENLVLLSIDYEKSRSFSHGGEKIGQYEFSTEFIREAALKYFETPDITGKPTPGRNGYGVFYFLSADQGEGGSCVYAWQSLDARRDGMTFAPNARRASIQFRVCDADSSVAELVSAFAALRVVPIFLPALTHS